MSANDPKVVRVAQALRQSLEQNAGVGVAINSHPNPFFVHVTGPIDLYKMAEQAVKGIAQFEEQIKARFEFDVKAVVSKIEAELKGAEGSVDEAIARATAKAGGELHAAEAVIQEATSQLRRKYASHPSEL